MFVEFGRQIGRPDSACRRRASSSINRKSPPNLSAISRRVRCISSMIVSVICFWIIIHHFFRSADDGDRNPKVVKNLVYSREDSTIRNVPTIPRQQVLYSMVCYNCDMQSVCSGLRRQNSPQHNFIGNLCDFGIEREQCNAL